MQAEDSLDLPAEPRWPAFIAVLAVSGLYSALPDMLTIGPRWLFPSLILAFLLPTIISHHTGRQRMNTIFGYLVDSLLTAVIGFLKDNHNAIAVDFTLKGDTDNPNFSLNENLSTRIAASMAGTLGVSIVNVAEGVGSLGRKGVEGAGSVVEGVGSAIKGLFGGGKKP